MNAQTKIQPATHTPGPWTRESVVQAGETVSMTIRAPYRVIAEMEIHHDGGWVPDAALIASAPELLAALEQARAVINELGSMTIITDYLSAKWPKTLLRMGLSEIASGAAIQKATGGAP